jgi:tungstate transport system permease protein
MAAVINGFGRVIAEVGSAMMLGGNIRGYTRTITTAIALETSKGEFAFGMALGLILLAVALSVNLLFRRFQTAAQS